MTIFYNLFSWEKMIRWSHVVSTMIDDDLAPQRDRSQKTKFMGPTWDPSWVLSAPDGPHVGPMNFAIRGYTDILGLVWISVYMQQN